MKTIISALVATTLLGTIALADEIDDQIQKLEKENKLLELQKKKKELQNEVNQNDTYKSNDSTLKSKNGKSKNGVFLGVEGVLGGGDMTVTIHDKDSSGTFPNSKSLFSSNTTFDLGLVGGYQHYFGDSQRHGIKVSAHVYSGFGNSWEISNDVGSEDGTPNIITGTISYIPIKVGLDVKYLWDFLEIGKHTLGLNVGLGYEFDSYVNGKDKSSNGFEENRANLFPNSLYPVIGLHYYYGHHQFEMMYRFGGILDELDNIVLQDDIEFYNDLTLIQKSYLTINYAYRF